MKQLFGLLFGMMIFSTAFSQKQAHRAPLSPEFVKYATEKSSKKSSDVTGKQYSTGYYPAPVELQFNDQVIQKDRKKAMEQLPASYDLRDFSLITSVKDQNPLGSCWTFSSVGAIESRWIQLGGYTRFSVDLSEENMGTCHGFEYGINDGGNDMIAAAYLTRLDGPATESSDPYSRNENAQCPTTPVVIPHYVPTVVWLPKDVNIVKKAILDYGAVTSSIHVDQHPFIAGGLLSMSNSDYTFYYGGTNPVNHGVLIVGWDDNITVTGGPSSPGQSTGAWIVKNSWGSDWGDKGYFYVSYKDSRFLSSVSLFPERIEKEEVDTMYMFDDLGMTTSYGFREEIAFGLAKYEAPTDHFIRKIGTFINTAGSIIDVEIYDDFDGDTLTNLLVSSENNFCKFPGYYTFDVPAIVNGDYYVKIKYNTPGYGYPIPAEAEISFQGEDYALPALKDSGFYWISEDELEWKAMGANIENYEADLSIRVYADRNTDINAFFTANKSLTCVGSSIQFAHQSNGEITSYEWNFGEGATPETANTAGPHEVFYGSPGLKDISLTITGPSGTKILTKKSYIEVVEELDIFLPYSEVKLVDGKTLPLNAYGADEYLWSPSEGLSSTTGSFVVASPTDTTTYTVSGTLGSCSGSTSITINVVENPDNDDICDALELTPGGWYGVYTNINATVEDGEPAPEEGECDEPMHWCVEGGLQNSVWFKFTGPENGVVSFDAPGMDNQLAIWKIETCDSIFSETGRELIAAFDDYYDESDQYAAALENVAITPGQQYYLQVDGSAGGAEGHFALIFWDYPLNAEEYKADIDNFEHLKVFPNPGNGIFEVALDGNDLETVRISVFNSAGKAVYMDEYVNIPGMNYTLYLQEMDAGIYYLRMEGENRVFNRNLIIK